MKKIIILVLIFIINVINASIAKPDIQLYKQIINSCDKTINYNKSKKYMYCRHKFQKCFIKDKISYYKYKEKVKFIFETEFRKENINKNDVKYIYNLISCESGQRPEIVSIDFGYGLFQLTKTKNKCKDVNCNINTGIKHLHKIYKISKNKFYTKLYCDYNKDECKNIIQQYTFRAYNGGFKQIDKLEKQITSFNKNFYTSTYIQANYCFSYKISGRFICFEKINVIYPIKIMFLNNQTN